MQISDLKLTYFKNYDQAQLSFDQKVCLFYGDNGSGKTNLLDAIHVLALSKSYFGMPDRLLIKDNESFYRIEAIYRIGEKQEKVTYKYQKGKKKEIAINTERIKRAADLIGKYPVVFIAPDDIKIVNGASKDRRDYMNRWLCQSNPTYLHSLLVYQRLVRQKDALLKQDIAPSLLAIEAINHQMVQHAEIIHDVIQSEIVSYRTLVQRYYEEISDGADQVDIQHASQLYDQDISDLYQRSVQEEIRAKRPLVGPQRDDYEYLLQNRPLKKYGSQGQIKTLLYGLRLAEYHCLAAHLSRAPLILLDDIFEKLDGQRLSSLINIINMGEYGQIFLSDTEVERSKKIFDERGITFAAYFVEKGSVERTH